MLGKKGRFSAVVKKYKVLLVSFSAFLLLIAALIILNLYSSIKIGQDAGRINAVSYMRDLTQAITRDLFNLRLSYGEDPNTPHMRSTIKELETNVAFYTNNIHAMSNGGEIVDADGDKIKIKKNDFPNSDTELENLEKEWQRFSPLINHYLEDAKTVNASLTALDHAVNQSQSSRIILSENLNKIASEIKQGANNRAEFLTYAQLLGILAIILYFVVFVFYVLRKLALSDEQADTARRETSEILSTVNEGLFLIDQDLVIGSQHSQALVNILGVEHTEGQKLDDLLEKIVTRKDMEIAAEFIQQLFNPRVKAKLINDLNPLDRVRATVTMDDGKRAMRFFSFLFSRVYEGEQIVRVLVSVTDITNTVLLEQKLEREQQHSDEQIEMLTAILKVDERMINSFLRNTRRITGNINNILRQSSRSQSDLQAKARDIFREAHSLKGEASALELGSFVTLAEALEEKIKMIEGKEQLAGDDFIPLAVSLEELIATLDRVDELVTKIGGFNAGNADDKPSTLSERRRRASNYDSYFELFALKIAERNRKRLLVKASGFDDSGLSEERTDLLKDLTIQLTRNAIVHGIENSNQRVNQGKSEKGHLRIMLRELSDELLELVVEDDGQGINFPLIREKIRRARNLSVEEANALSEQSLIAAIFRSGFSTLNQSSQDAGRGVGTDVIKARLKALGGKITVVSKAGKFTRFVIRFPKNSRAEKDV